MNIWHELEALNIKNSSVGSHKYELCDKVLTKMLLGIFQTTRYNFNVTCFVKAHKFYKS